MTVKTYTTAQGDMWDGIAKKTMGSEYHMDLLLEANLEYREIVVFPANVILTIPDTPAKVALPLPPWRK